MRNKEFRVTRFRSQRIKKVVKTRFKPQRIKEFGVTGFQENNSVIIIIFII